MPGNGDTGGRLLITNLPYAVDWKALKDHCWGCRVYARRANIVCDPKSYQSTGHALVELEDNRPWQLHEAARKLTGTILHARSISCGVALGDVGFRERSRSGGRQWRDHSPPPMQRTECSRSGGRQWRDHDQPPLPRTKGNQTRAVSLPPFAPRPPRPSSCGGGDSHPRRQTSDSDCRRLFVEDLSSTVRWQDLKDLLVSQWYPVIYVGVLHFEGNGFGIIEFKERFDAMEACIKLSGALLHGMPLRLRQDRGEFDNLLRDTASRNTLKPDHNVKRSKDTEDTGRAALLPISSLPAGWGSASAGDAEASNDYAQKGTPDATGC